jgi:hypothetical protein
MKIMDDAVDRVRREERSHNAMAKRNIGTVGDWILSDIIRNYVETQGITEKKRI